MLIGVIQVSERQVMRVPAGRVMNLSYSQREKMGQRTRGNAGWGVCKAFVRPIWEISRGRTGGYRELLSLIDEDCREDCLIRNKHEGFMFEYI
jgi:phosphoribosyl-AMP cyclohydrolase